MTQTSNLPVVPRQKVQSAAIAAIGWLPIPYPNADGEYGIVDVVYVSSSHKAYRFYDVSRTVYEAVMADKSIGAAFNRLINHAGFPCSKLQEQT